MPVAWTKIDVTPIEVWPWGVIGANNVVVNNKQVSVGTLCDIVSIENNDAYVRFIDLTIPNYPDLIKIQKTQLTPQSVQAYSAATNNPPKIKDLEFPSWGTGFQKTDHSDKNQELIHQGTDYTCPYLQYPPTLMLGANVRGDGDRPRYSIKYSGTLFGNGDGVLFPDNSVVISQTPYKNPQIIGKVEVITSHLKQTKEINQSEPSYIAIRDTCGASHIPMKPYENIIGILPVVDTKRCLANPAAFCTLALIPEDKLVEWLQKMTAQGITEGEVELKQIDWMNTDEYRTAKGRTFNDLLKGK
ncbi:MAG: hypothetical protein WCP60_08595 [bacterium]